MCFFFGVTMFLLLPVHLRALGADELEIGLVMGCGGLGSALGFPLCGVLGDRHGRRPFLLGGYALMAACALAFLATRSLPLLGVLRFVQGIGFAAGLVAGMAMVADLAPEGRLAEAIGLYGISSIVTHALGPTCAEALAARWGFSAVFAFSALLSTFGLAALARVRETHIAQPRAFGTWESGPSIFRIALRPELRAPLAGALLAATAFGAVITFLPDYATLRGLGRVSPLFVGYTIAAIGVRLRFGHLSDRVGRRRVALPTFFGYSASVLALAGITAGWQLWPIGLLLGASHGLCYPALNAMAIERAEPAVRGRAMSLYNLAFSLGVTLGAFGFGPIAHAAGYPTMYLVSSAVVLLGAAVVARDRPL